jgi:hypothetical protein
MNRRVVHWPIAASFRGAAVSIGDPQNIGGPESRCGFLTFL